MTPWARARAIIGGSAGNLIEWYDWFAYTAFSLYFAKAFFPGSDDTAKLLKTAAVFAIGFLARPVGAWVTGVIADRAGRKRALVLSIALMCLGSLIMALTPTYARIGVWAPIILTATRLLQGLSIGGEYGASATYLAEMAGRARRGLWSSFQFVTLIGGQLAAVVVLIALQASLSERQIEAFGWRIPFIIGALLAVVVLWLQSRLDETPSFEAVRAERRQGSLTWRLIRDHPKECGIILALTAAGSLGFYCYTAYMPTFLVNSAHFSRRAASEISLASLAVYLLLQPIGGALADRLGRRTVLAAGLLAGAVAAWPILSAMAGARSPWAALALLCLALVLLTGYSSVSAVVKAELFPAAVRGLGVALPYALANAIFGGGAEYVALAFKQAGRESGFFIYVGLTMAVAGVVALFMRETRTAGLIVED
jgi:MHS family alpha-ketoglutarate permease-like MFS transporter